MLKKCVGANNLKGSPKAIQFVYWWDVQKREDIYEPLGQEVVKINVNLSL
jgi:hypothetical protein